MSATTRNSNNLAYLTALTMKMTGLQTLYPNTPGDYETGITLTQVWSHFRHKLFAGFSVFEVLIFWVMSGTFPMEVKPYTALFFKALLAEFENRTALATHWKLSDEFARAFHNVLSCATDPSDPRHNQFGVHAELAIERAKMMLNYNPDDPASNPEPYDIEGHFDRISALLSNPENDGHFGGVIHGRKKRAIKGAASPSDAAAVEVKNDEADELDFSNLDVYDFF